MTALRSLLDTFRNDASDWAAETTSDPRDTLELLPRVISVSLEILKNVRALPKLDVLPE